ncbi:para-nitrobenzyl esterase [Bryocella elongata]|uniref:Carboxylic ester hydrolase n=1 Tax=Bryocella elongata TaxID=863522 RepID=A0A1H6BI54_9BACT|nr:carboxylesterase family protein [Bryocella elongata]SEG60409.1 para-nitrobenzyl esterase [Bryocella elongata]
MNRRELLKSGSIASTMWLAPRPLQVLGQTYANDPLVAHTGNGPVRGYRTAEGMVGFKGIPYGMDTAKTRFAAPQRPDEWSEVRDCLAWAPRAPQVVGARPAYESGKRDAPPPTGYHLPPDEGPQSEDCLHLNLWTPSLQYPEGRAAPRLLRPVMFYIHGGAFANGTANAALYDGSRLAKRGDVVVVCVNHRLNAFGYMYLADAVPGQGFEDSGNAGQLDLILALQWVRENIAHFGGDPNRVMIFGQSGGGAKCATLMAQPPAKGLFHRVLSMSGQQVTGVEPAHATPRAQAALKALGVAEGATPAEAAKVLRSASMEEIQRATRSAGYFGPVRDGRSLPVDPFSPTDPQQSTSIPMILGNTHDETRVLIGGGQPALFSLTWEALPAALEKNDPFLRSDTVSLPAAEVVAKYREWHPDYSPADVFFAVTTDSRSWRGEVIEADRRAADPKSQPHTWVYQLNWKSGVDGGKWGAPHTLDIPLAFDNVALSPGMVGASPADQARAQHMAEIVSETYIAFARTGNPNNPKLPHWPTFDLRQRATLILNDPPRIEDDPRGRERSYLGQVPYVQPGT